MSEKDNLNKYNDHSGSKPNCYNFHSNSSALECSIDKTSKQSEEVTCGQSRSNPDIIPPIIQERIQLDTAEYPLRPSVIQSNGINPRITTPPIPNGMIMGPDDPFFSEIGYLPKTPTVRPNYDPIGPLGREPDFDEFIPSTNSLPQMPKSSSHPNFHFGSFDNHRGPGGFINECQSRDMSIISLLCNVSLMFVYVPNKSYGYKKTITQDPGINGILNLYKPPGIRCTQITNRIKRIIADGIGQNAMYRIVNENYKNSSGVLAVGIGSGTKALENFLKADKQYLCTGEFGYETHNNCMPGEITAKAPYDHITDEMLNATLRDMHGKQMQFPPIFSAKKQDGKCLYKYAVENKPVDIKPSVVYIYSIIREPHFQLPKFQIRVTCSHGCYMRSLIRDIGLKLNSRATLVDLVSVL
ncbi:bifunctional Pseudouridine synthase [Babesia duncani]|uniref:tRNA pseudouridine(55) synthase n=1 Tax=Babesia duncani TaxID=323732 RepID=A0AAD9PKZ4_9APIC|nr:bifunctional Pseudouridine synthase [Babesia duncani]